MDSVERPERVSFHFGETMETITAKLMARGFRLINDEIKYKFS